MKTVVIPYLEEKKKERSRPKTVDVIDEQIYEKLQLKASRKGMPLRQYANYIFEWKVKRDNLMKKLYPDITKLTSENGMVVYEDTKTNQVVRVSVKNHKLFCSLCKTNACKHIEVTRSDLDYPSLFDVEK